MMLNQLRVWSFIFAMILSVPTVTIYAQTTNSKETSVVYHIDDAQSQGLKGLRNIRNHLDVSPSTKIVVVTHADGVDLLMEGGKDKKNNAEYAPLISALKSRGVTFEVCEITIKNRGLNKNQFILEADYTPSGVVRIADLQYKNSFAYIKP
jgi:intracellular sulfur oxidation DsrE/DsrF family protein